MANDILIQISRNDLKNIVYLAIQDYFNNHNKNEESDTLLTIDEAARFLNIAIPTLYAKTAKKKIPFHKKGKRLYFSKSELINWIKGVNNINTYTNLTENVNTHR